MFFSKITPPHLDSLNYSIIIMSVYLKYIACKICDLKQKYIIVKSCVRYLAFNTDIMGNIILY